MHDADEAELEAACERIFARIKRDRFFGVAEFHFQDGKLVRIKKQETLTPKDLLRGAAQ